MTKSAAPEVGSAEAEAVDASGVVATGEGDRARFLRGELSRAEYLELEIERALAPFAGAVDAERLAVMRAILRAELESDPILVELSERALGR